jgi:diguanylate cyclase (GGDEF)-like protein
MKQFIVTVDTPGDVETNLAACMHDGVYRSVFIQIYSSINKAAWLESLAHAAHHIVPDAVITGATTNGEIIGGYTTAGKTVITISLFDTTAVELISIPCCPGDERAIGTYIQTALEHRIKSLTAIMLLCTAISMDSSEFIKPLADISRGCPVFGAAAGYYLTPQQSLILCGTKAYDTGIAVILFSGSDLAVTTSSFLGWKPFSREMTVTAAREKTAVTIDGKPAFAVYRHYLGIENDDEFDTNAVGFSFLIERSGTYIARVPIAVTADGGILFGADIYEGDRFRIGYADPAMIITNTQILHEKMKSFNPDAIFLFSCGTRRRLLRSDVQLETVPFEQYAPTTGFYTAGEYFGSENGLQLLNSSIVTVGFREGPPDTTTPSTNTASLPEPPVLPQHDTKSVSYLVHFIEAVTSELEEANRQLSLVASSDKLTGLNNRNRLDEILTYEIARARRHGSSFSVILIDIDFFKKINDTYGHLVGDDVLIEFAARLKSIFIRETDTAGRWGGEEFLCIIPDTPREQAITITQTFSTAVSATPFIHGIPLTCSAGVTAYEAGDTELSITGRVDQALYDAKQRGRNMIIPV